MKITKIAVSNFRGFPGPAEYDFEFGKARNLFIYGENGSGKSSLFRAIQEFFNRSRDAKPFTDHLNNRDANLTSGHVTVQYEDRSVQSWTNGNERQLKQAPTSQTALQAGFLDYRHLLETNFTQRGESVNLFDIAVEQLVRHIEVTIDGRSSRIEDLWLSVTRSNPANKGHYSRYLLSSAQHIKRFNTGFVPLIKPLIEKASELLAKFLDPDFILGASYQPIEYDTTTRRFKNMELILSVHRGGTQILNHHTILNEARLSAIGLVVYLAGLLITVPTASHYPKLLVLDDVLVGLDMANRWPVLTILKEYFADWQIVLLTHDRVWYEMVQVELEGKDWQAYELWLADDGFTPIHRSRESGADFFLARAQRHLAANDDRAAAVYARAAFETTVKGYCDKKSVAVPYKKDPRRMTAESFWDAAKKRALTAAPSVAEKQALEVLFQAVDAAKKVVLNPLSHSAPQPVTKLEIEAAITAIANLRFE